MSMKNINIMCNVLGEKVVNVLSSFGPSFYIKVVNFLHLR